MKHFTVTLTEEELRALCRAAGDAYVAAADGEPIEVAYERLLGTLHGDDFVEIAE